MDWIKKTGYLPSSRIAATRSFPSNLLLSTSILWNLTFTFKELFHVFSILYLFILPLKKNSCLWQCNENLRVTAYNHSFCLCKTFQELDLYFYRGQVYKWKFCLSVCLSVCPSSLLIVFLIQTLSSRNLPQSTLVTQPLPRYPMSPSMSPMPTSQLVNWSPMNIADLTSPISGLFFDTRSRKEFL